MTRQYPELPPQTEAPTRPISFVCVRYSDEFKFNIARSACVQDALNEFIVVDNTANLFFDTLGQAINAGLAEARHELVAIVHEDVFLVPGWQGRFEQSLAALEKHDPDWALVGAAGTDETGLKGHWSDPDGYTNTFGAQPFTPVQRIDEQIIILRRNGGLAFDDDLPGIHNIGRDLARQAEGRGLRTYAIDAPTIHKYANRFGKPIQDPEESIKIRDRRSLTYRADRFCSDEYHAGKWGSDLPEGATDYGREVPSPALDSPVILLGRGGSGTRLLSLMAQDLGLFVGNDLNVSGDCMEIVGPVYRSVVRKYRCPSTAQKRHIVPDLRAAASAMLERGGQPAAWGFKLPEVLLILPEIAVAFPHARYVHFRRDPFGTVLRRSHMTARLDNHVGRIALPVAYDHFGIARADILTDDMLDHMAVTTMHQLALVEEHKARTEPSRWLELSFEATIADAGREVSKLAAFCGLEPVASATAETVDAPRSAVAEEKFSDEQVERVRRRLAALEAFSR